MIELFSGAVSNGNSPEFTAAGRWRLICHATSGDGTLTLQETVSGETDSPTWQTVTDQGDGSGAELKFTISSGAGGGSMIVETPGGGLFRLVASGTSSLVLDKAIAQGNVRSS